MLGTRTHCGRMQGLDESTELWRHPDNSYLFTQGTKSLLSDNCFLTSQPSNSLRLSGDPKLLLELILIDVIVKRSVANNDQFSMCEDLKGEL